MAAEPQSQPSFTRRRKWAVGFDVVVRTVVVLAVVVMTNYLAGKFFHRQYLSANTRTELSPRTVSLVESLTNDVTVIVYYDREDELFTTLTALLREYSALNPRIQVEIVDYLRDAADAQRVKQKYKLPEASKDEQKNFIIFDCDNRWRAVPGRSLADYDLRINKEKQTYERPPTALKAEAIFDGSLLAVTSLKPFKAYVLQGHGEHSLTDGDELRGYLDFRTVLEQNYVKVEPLTLIGSNTVPQDCNLLVVPGPRSAISEGELEKIDQYLTEGGRLFALFNSQWTDHRPSLEKILARWGVSVTEAVVQDPKNSLNTLKSYPGVDVTVGAFSLHPAVSSLVGSYLNLIMPRPIFPIAAPDRTAEAPKVEVLFATAPTAVLVNNPKLAPTNYPLAVAVERTPAAGVVASRGTTRMILVGDSFFLANGPMKLLANRDFADYAINWLLERPQFMQGIGPKPIAEFRIALTGAQMQTIQWLLLGALPGGILLFGGLVWLRRRK
jgi:gliding motility-associatede transport system auxiliary component